jgi:hypothetical protein
MTMSSNELLLGFDAREMWLDVAEYWPEERKRSFLLRQDIVKPLSTDTLVWRSVFDVERLLHRPQWTGPIQELWEDVQALENALSTTNHRTKPSWVIAFTLFSASSDSEEQAYWTVRTQGVNPCIRDPAWHLLGYDVADRYLLSGLTNLSWDPVSTDEVQAIGQKYIPYLNEYHLFTSVEPATEFLPLAEEGAREHAPFFVFGLWLIKKEEGLAHPD